MPFITLSGFRQISMKPTSQKALHEEFKINQWKLHNALIFFRLIIVTARKRSLGKVIFLHQFVILFTGGACMVAPGGMHGCSGGACVVARGACMVLFGGHAWFYSGGMHGFIWRACMVLFGGGVSGFFSFLDTMRYGQWAGGTHPTGMHSCCL